MYRKLVKKEKNKNENYKKMNEIEKNKKYEDNK